MITMLDCRQRDRRSLAIRFPLLSQLLPQRGMTTLASGDLTGLTTRSCSPSIPQPPHASLASGAGQRFNATTAPSLASRSPSFGGAAPPGWPCSSSTTAASPRSPGSRSTSIFCVMMGRAHLHRCLPSCGLLPNVSRYVVVAGVAYAAPASLFPRACCEDRAFPHSSSEGREARVRRDWGKVFCSRWPSTSCRRRARVALPFALAIMWANARFRPGVISLHRCS